MMPRLALSGKPRGMVAIGAGRDYIWAMDDKELDKFAKRFLGPARTVRLEDCLHSRKWQCSRCKLTVTNVTPISVPAPCPVCGGIAFEAIEQPPH
jgi:rubrerythrin